MARCDVGRGCAARVPQARITTPLLHRRIANVLIQSFPSPPYSLSTRIHPQLFFSRQKLVIDTQKLFSLTSNSRRNDSCLTLGES